MENLSDKELLQFALENGIINLNNLQAQIEMNERKKYLEMHKNKVWQDDNGKYKTYIPDESAKGGRRLIERKSKQDFEDCIIAAYKDIENEPYIETIFYRWLNQKMSYGEITKQTYDRYECDFVRFFKDARIYNMKFRYITENMLEDFIKLTIHNKKLTVKMWSNLKLSKNTFTKKYTKDSLQVFKNYEVQELEKYVLSKEPDILEYGILFAFLTGMRAGELSSLSYLDFDAELNAIIITKTEIHYKDESGKTIYEVREEPKTEAGFRGVILSDEALNVYKKIRALNPFGKYLFECNGERIRGYMFTRRLYSLCKKLNITRKSIHKARKTYGTKLIKANIDEKLIQQQMGHKDISTTRKYYLFNNLTNEEQIEQIRNAISY